MGVNAIKGTFGIGVQAVKGTAAGTINYLPAENIGVTVDQQAQAIPPEVGGKLFPLASYKGGYMIAGDVAINPRPESLGWLLLAYSGSATSANVSGSVYRSSFFENQTDKAAIPYLTLVKNVGGVWCDKYTDCRLDTLRVDVSAAGLLKLNAGFVGISVASMTVPAAPSVDLGPVFQTSQGYLHFTDIGTSTIHAKATRVTLELSNNISRQEHNIGAYTLDDVALIRRTARVTFEAYLESAVWYNAFYNGGTTAWDPTLVSAQLEIDIQTGPFVSGSTRGEVRIVIPQVDYYTYPVSLAGNDLIKVTGTAEVTLSTGASQPFYFELTNTTASYPAS